MTARDLPPAAPGFGQLLRRLRTAAAISQEVLAERAGLSVRGLGDLERGVHQAPRLETVRLLADALQLEATERAALIAAARPELAVSQPPTSERAPWLIARALPMTRLIGRNAEVAGLCRLLTEEGNRLVTLIGPGGVGKTRLARAVADALTGSFADGSAFVDLASVRDPTLVAAAVATALGIREVGAHSVADQLAAYVRTRAMVLVLDNFEQVLDAAPMVADLLATASGLRVLVTSREPLRLSGEQVIPVGPLALPDAGQVINTDESQRPEAMTLFIERASAADPSFALSAENAAAIAEIVRRLDGLPLAIELAAARVRTLPPAALLTRLERQALPLLTGGPRDQPDRQRTIRDAIGWSYDLLTSAEQRLFRTLSVFVGGFTLEAAAAVATAYEGGELAVLDGVTSLIDKSLVHRVPGPDSEPRFTMLETIREYGVEQLVATDEENRTREAHVAWVVNLTERAELEVVGRDQVQWLRRLEEEHPNLRAALGWLEHTGDVTTRLRVASALMWFWYIRGHLGEGRAWLERALADGEDAPPSLRGRAQVAVSCLAFGQSNYPVVLAFAEASLAVSESIGDTTGIAAARFMLGMVPQMQGNYALSMARLEEVLEQWRQIGDRFWVGVTLTQLGETVSGLPDFERAAALHEEALVVLREIGGPWTTSVTLTCLGSVVLDQGDIARAEDLIRESLTLGWDIDDRWYVGHALATLARIAERQRQPRRAARLIGVVDAVCDRIHAPLLQIPAQATRYEFTIDAVRAQLGDEAFAAARAAGRAMPLTEAIREATVTTPDAP